MSVVNKEESTERRKSCPVLIPPVRYNFTVMDSFTITPHTPPGEESPCLILKDKIRAASTDAILRQPQSIVSNSS